ncbi:hypothetical protein L2E82_15119 [Cichorium intybus]|uniref:Uncharacterized protein n=1 Tax=Cichorium intybus TaxID=13427 RepID=A0ACB9F1X1_CICIN|nr:hypothetical protein L2E82_15119 [Cichorium intybus]
MFSCLLDLESEQRLLLVLEVLVSLLIYTSLQCSTTSPSTSSATEPPPPPPLLQHFQLSLPRQSSLFSFEETNR